jgi:ribonucleoside-diphosphate reductase alpha chain
MAEVKNRPKILDGKTYKVKTGCGNLYVSVNSDDEKVFEVFAKLGKSGGCPSCFTEALTRSISLGHRAGVELEEYVKDLSGIHCSNPTVFEGDTIKSCPDAISQVLKNFLKEVES